MAIMVDTGVFSGAYNSRDKYHSEAVELLRDALKGEYGAVFTTDYVFDEATTLTLYRTRNVQHALRLGEALLSSPRITIINVTEDLFRGAWQVFKKYSNIPLSFTDAITVEVMRSKNMALIMSLDEDFDKIPQVRRITT